MKKGKAIIKPGQKEQFLLYLSGLPRVTAPASKKEKLHPVKELLATQ